MKSRRARIQEFHRSKTVVVAIALLAAAVAESETALYSSSRKLAEVSDIDKAYLLPGEVVQQRLRHKCRGIGQFDQLRGEWVRLCNAHLPFAACGLVTASQLPV